MELRATLPNHIPACRSELKLLIMKSFSYVETVKEASAVCRSFLDGVVIFWKLDMKMYMSNQHKTPVPAYRLLSSPSNKLTLFINHYETPCILFTEL